MKFGTIVFICGLIKKGHTAFSIDPYLSHVFDPIPPEKGVGIEEGSPCMASTPWASLPGGAFGLVTLA